MIRKTILTAAVLAIAYIAPSFTASSARLHAADRVTDAYLTRAAGLMVGYARQADAAARRGDIVSQARAFQNCALALYSLPTYGVHPRAVEAVRRAGDVCNSCASAVLELNDPTLPDALKTARILDLVARVLAVAESLEALRDR